MITFHLGLDSIGGDFKYVGKLPVDELIKVASSEPVCVAFNTLGFLKNEVKPILSQSKYFSDSDGLYVFTDRCSLLNAAVVVREQAIQPSSNCGVMKTVSCKIMCNWTSPENVLQEFMYMLDDKSNLTYKNIRFTTEKDADYYVIINFPRDVDHYHPSKSIIIQMEPWCHNNYQKWGVKTWGDWSDPNPNRFLKVLTTRNALNLVQWIFDLPPNQLLKNQPTEKKTKVLSAICGPKYFDPGHIRRIDFLKFFEKKIETSAVSIDIYGYDNTHKFVNYCGSLEKSVKHSGMLSYKYFIAAENNRENNYITEKLWEPILCECLTFYDGAPNVADWVDPRAYISVDLSDHESSYRTIIEAISNDEWSKRLPFIREMKMKIINELGFMPTVEKIISDRILIEENYIFLQGVDQINYDLKTTQNNNNNKNVDECLIEALNNEKCVAINTLGYCKYELHNLSPSPYFGNTDGIYIKRKVYDRFKVEQSKNLNLVWQTPCITELVFYQQNISDPSCIQFPWANYLDNKHYTNQDQVIKLLAEKYQLDLKQLPLKDLSIYTCCQHVGFRDLIPLFDKIGIKTVYSPHKIIGEDEIDGIVIKPCPLFAVNFEDQNRNQVFQDYDNDRLLNKSRKYLFSFQGGYQQGYLTDIRLRIFEFKKLSRPDVYIKNTGEWHYNIDVYNHKTDSNEHKLLLSEYNIVLLESKFSLCPSGSGPNSLRLWESLATGSIPVILADTLELPEHSLWKKACIFLPENDVEKVLEILENISLEEEREMRSNCLKLYQHFSNNYRNQSLAESICTGNRLKCCEIDVYCKRALMVNHRKWYQLLSKDIDTHDFYGEENNDDNQEIKEYNDAVLSRFGSIYLTHTNEKIIHGYGTEFNNFPANVNKITNKVITFSGYMSNGTWHFPMESLVLLRTIFNQIGEEELKEYYLYLDEIGSIEQKWLDVFEEEFSKFKGIIISKDGPVLVNKLLAPVRSKIGNPTSEQIKWLKETVWTKLGLGDVKNNQTRVILMKRNFSRTLVNFDVVYGIVKDFAENVGLVLYLHDDSNLPSLKDQLCIFNEAKYVIGSHGAGSVNLLACRSNTVFIEFLNIIDINICYLRLARFLGICYYSVPVFRDSTVCTKILSERLKFIHSNP